MIKTSNLLIIGILILGVGTLVLNLTEWRRQEIPFGKLNAKEKYQRIIAERDLAIKEAKEAGDYRCCIDPPCTMCYMEANQWNNFQAGTCACDDLIAKGEEPCPQCKQGLCQDSSRGTTCPLR